MWQHEPSGMLLCDRCKVALVNADEEPTAAHCRIPTEDDPGIVPPFPELTDHENKALSVIVKAAHRALHDM